MEANLDTTSITSILSIIVLLVTSWIVIDIVLGKHSHALKLLLFISFCLAAHKYSLHHVVYDGICQFTEWDRKCVFGCPRAYVRAPPSFWSGVFHGTGLEHLFVDSGDDGEKIRTINTRRR